MDLAETDDESESEPSPPPPDVPDVAALAGRWRPPPFPTAPTRTVSQGNPYAAVCVLFAEAAANWKMPWTAVEFLLRGLWAIHGDTRSRLWHGRASPWLPRNSKHVKEFLTRVFPPGVIRVPSISACFS